jgi:hypothetical protein
MRWLLFLLLLTTSSFADTVFKYGVNVPSGDKKLATTKALFIGEQSKLLGSVISQWELGGWFDNSGIEGRKSSVLGSVSLGVHVNAGYLFTQALIGPALMLPTDSNLGGPLQFNNDFALGLRDPETKAAIGFAYKHISSAGIFKPNKGRDFIMFRVSIPW